MNHFHIPLGIACFVLALLNESYREFASLSGLLFVADAISRLRPEEPDKPNKPEGPRGSEGSEPERTPPPA